MPCIPVSEGKPPMLISEVLDKAAEKIAPEGCWTQHHLGKDSGGRVILDAGNIGSAVCFCAAGAIWRVLHDAGEAIGSTNRAQQAFDEIRRFGVRGGVGTWNDQKGRTANEVAEKLRSAAAKARGEGR